ncbi:MAG: hypothetical protein KA746_06430 [Pyrinomonadaceae bacterium]|nr:hypothetical protein [Pyrinomonadaceae bacterium]MBP6211942.1 hypothetical protein [Pyrinomonadaceae bacterium]
MRFSRLGLLVFVTVTVLIGANCSYYNRVIARKNLVDGAKAYKDRKFGEAEQLFRYAASKDPNGDTVEGRTAQLSLARTLHSIYIGNRSDKSKAEQALTEYKKSLPLSLKELKETSAAYDKNKAGTDEQRRYLAALSSVNSTTSAIASLYENLTQPDKAKEWQAEVANSADYPVTARARALSSLTAKMNTCANDITDTEATKKTIKKDGKDVYQFVKPAAPEDLTRLQQCIADGTKLIDQAVALEPDEVKNAASLNVTTLTDTQLALYGEIFKVFESTRSYKASLLVQAGRLAEMEGRTADHDRLKLEADAAKAKFQELSDIVKKMQAEVDARAVAKEEAEKKNANSNANKK